MKLLQLKTLFFDVSWNEVGWDCQLAVLRDQAPESFEDLIARLCDAGLVCGKENAYEWCRFVTLDAEDGTVSLSYFSYDHSIWVLLDPLTGRVRPPMEVCECPRVTENTLCIFALDYSDPAVNGGNGMCYVLTLADGSYLVYDGGCTPDGEALYQYLKEHNRRSDGQIVIAAWILTHADGDHFFGFRAFARTHAADVTLERLLVHPRMQREGEPYEKFFYETIPAEILPLFSGATLVMPHTGQRLYIRDAVIEVLLTQENHYHRRIGINESSLVTRVTLGGQTMLFPGDAQSICDQLLPVMYGNDLRSDFYQVAHHGCSGGTKILYDLIRPRFAMWTTKRAKFEERRERSYRLAPNWYLLQMLEEAFLHDEGHKILPLPYRKEV